MNNEKGFSLIEASFAITLFLIVMGSFAGVIFSYTKHLDNAREKTVTAYILIQQAEKLKHAIKQNTPIATGSSTIEKINGTKWDYRQTVDATGMSDPDGHSLYRATLELQRTVGGTALTDDSLTIYLYSKGI